MDERPRKITEIPCLFNMPGFCSLVLSATRRFASSPGRYDDARAIPRPIPPSDLRACVLLSAVEIDVPTTSITSDGINFEEKILNKFEREEQVSTFPRLPASLGITLNAGVESIYDATGRYAV